VRQLYKAQLVGVYEVREMPEELRPFLNLQARRENRQLKMSDNAVMLQVVGTSSFVAVFLDTIGSVSELDERLRQQDTEMTEVTKMTIERLLAETKGV
jgi:hypothetical protein